MCFSIIFKYFCHYLTLFSTLSTHPTLNILSASVSYGCELRFDGAAAGGLPGVSLCWIWPRGPLLKRSSMLHLQDHLTRPLPASDPAPHSQTLYAGAEKSSHRGVQCTQGLSTGPYSSFSWSSSLVLADQSQESAILTFLRVFPCWGTKINQLAGLLFSPDLRGHNVSTFP